MNRESISKAKERLQYFNAKKDILTNECDDLKKKAEEYSTEIIILEETNRFFMSAIQGKIEEVRHRVEDVINRGMSYVFKSDDIVLTVSTVIKNNKTQFVVTLRDGEVESSKLRDSFGGV